MLRWTLVSCDCVAIEDENNIIQSYEKVCNIHQGLVGSTRNNAVRNDNHKFGDGYGYLRNNFAQQLFSTVDGNLILKDGITINRTWTGLGEDAVLNLSVTGFTLTQNQKNTIQSFFDTKYGVGKVVVQ